MTIIKKKTETMLSFTVALSLEAHSIARELSSNISNPKKSKQVYLNTLAVFSVDFYLRCLGFETSWHNCDSRDRAMVKLMNVADLEIKNLGKLECRYLLGDNPVCQIPPEVWEDRLGYVIVKLEQSLKSAEIIGFFTQPAAEVSVEKMQSLEELIEYLSCVKPVKKTSQITQIGKWLQGNFETEWLDVHQLFSPDRVGLAFREQINITKVKKIDLGVDFNGNSIALIVKIVERVEDEIDIIMQVHPLDRTFLPPGLQLVVSDLNNNPILDATAREKDNFIQLEFAAEEKESFSATIVFGEEKIVQEFTI